MDPSLSGKKLVLIDITDISDDEFARRGNALFEERVRPHVDVDEEAHKFVAIDVKTGEYEVDESEVEATDRLVDREPEAEGRIWLRRVGYEHAHRLGLSAIQRRERWD